MKFWKRFLSNFFNMLKTVSKATVLSGIVLGLAYAAGMWNKPLIMVVLLLFVIIGGSLLITINDAKEENDEV